MVSFVILHYKNIDDTMDCINSIKKIKDKDYKIIVVDNNSGVLKDSKLIKKNVDDFIELEENLGFAKGNNKGIEIAKEKYKSDYVVVINNDTVIEQTDFIDRIKKCYSQTKFDALGLKINTDGGDSVNPFPSYKTLEEVRNAIKKSELLINIYNNRFRRFLLKWYLKIKRLIKKPMKNENASKMMEDVSLHGCAIIFSKKYLKKYKHAFYNETFLYHEEEFLEYRRKNDNLKFVYDPSITIFHKEGSSLNYNYNDNLYKKLIFREKNIIKSLRMLEDVMENNRRV